ncbi:MAG: ribose 1,5-bisphosphate isomerase [Candidatus Verstraetearchaeota archaeon]|nr:ribose 1,5-bisphosphate isomerase [Candidatus Verstraetearchaeota archaeon]
MVDVELLRLAEDIKLMRIRGAAEIGRAAASGMKHYALSSKAPDAASYIDGLNEAYRVLLNTRPTAVSLANSLNYIRHRVLKAHKEGATLEVLRQVTVEASDAFVATSYSAVKRISEFGARRIRNGDLIMTHCNSSVAISTLLEAKRSGKEFSVIATETRPRFQGRITAKELAEKGIPVTLIVDSAARYFMPKVDKVVVGSDVVTANGAVVNKIGTSLIALAAKEARVRVYVCAETYKFSPSTVMGELVEIEERPPTEVVPEEEIPLLGNVRIANPAFDVTPAEMIDAIITERGVIPPQAAILILMEEFGYRIGEEYFGKVFVEEEGV